MKLPARVQAFYDEAQSNADLNKHMIAVLKGHFGNGWLQLFDLLWKHKNPESTQQIAKEATTLKNKLAYAFGQKLQRQGASQQQLLPEAKEL